MAAIVVLKERILKEGKVYNWTILDIVGIVALIWAFGLVSKKRERKRWCEVII